MRRRRRSRRPGSASSAAISPTRRRSAARRRGRRGRQLRRRVARRPLDPRARGVPRDRRHRRPRPARGDPGAGPPGPDIRFLQVSTDEVYGSLGPRARRRGSPARAALAVRRREGRRRAARPELPRHLRRRCRHHPRLEHVRPVPAPREAHPAVRHQRARRPAAAALRRRSPAARLAARHRPRRGDRVRAPGRRSGRDLQRAGGTELPNREVERRLLGHLGKPWSLVRQVADRPGHDRRYAMDGTKLAALGWSPDVSVRRGPCSDRRLVPRARGVVAGARDGDWDAYYERQYGHRLRDGVAAAGSDPRMRVAVTGAAGRLGRALVTALADAPFTGPGGPIAWGRAEFDLDAPGRCRGPARPRPRRGRRPCSGLDRRRRLRPRPGHGRRPERGRHRGARARVRDARRRPDRDLDQRGLRRDAPGRIGYGAGRQARAGEPVRRLEAPRGVAARDAYTDAARGQLAIVRTAWLFGPPGRPDFPAKILSAAREAARRAEPLASRATRRLADVQRRSRRGNRGVPRRGTFAGIHHVVNGLFATRADWARDVVGRAMLEVEIVNVPMSTWQRDSTPPRWGVLEPTPLPRSEPLRPVARRDGRLRPAPAARDRCRWGRPAR